MSEDERNVTWLSRVVDSDGARIEVGPDRLSDDEALAVLPTELRDLGERLLKRAGSAGRRTEIEAKGAGLLLDAIGELKAYADERGWSEIAEQVRVLHGAVRRAAIASTRERYGTPDP